MNLFLSTPFSYFSKIFLRSAKTLYKAIISYYNDDNQTESIQRKAITKKPR